MMAANIYRRDQTMSTLHTPGPWETTRDGWIYPADYAERVSANKFDAALAKAYGVSDQARANADLIAAAPELLDALQQCVAAYREHRDQQPTGHLWPDPNHIFHACYAIAKATGQCESASV
jgi:hypothetical protein